MRSNPLNNIRRGELKRGARAARVSSLAKPAFGEADMGKSPSSKILPEASNTPARAEASETAPSPWVRHEHIRGLVVDHIDQCRCGCSLLLVATHSTKSDILIWKCVNCRQRRGENNGRISAEHIEELVSFYDRHGDPLRPLVWCPDFGGYFASGH